MSDDPEDNFKFLAAEGRVFETNGNRFVKDLGDGTT